MVWLACKTIRFDGSDYQPCDVVLRDDQDPPCNMRALQAAGLVMHVPEGSEMWRPDKSAQWRLRGAVHPQPEPSPQPPAPTPVEAAPEPPPAPVPQTDSTDEPVRRQTEEPKKRGKRKGRRRGGG